MKQPPLRPPTKKQLSKMREGDHHRRLTAWQGRRRTRKDLRLLAGREIACPGCSRDDIHFKRCHTTAIVDEFKRLFPDLEPPAPVSSATKCIEGKGGLQDVYVDRDAVHCGRGPPRGAATGSIGLYLPYGLFANNVGDGFAAALREEMDASEEEEKTKIV